MFVYLTLYVICVTVAFTNHLMLFCLNIIVLSDSIDNSGHIVRIACALAALGLF